MKSKRNTAQRTSSTPKKSIYDVLDRRSYFWARDSDRSALTLRVHNEYGDAGDPDQPVNVRDANRSANRLGRVHASYDEAGLVIYELYDMKGNVLEKTRRVISDAAILSIFELGSRTEPMQPYTIDWEPKDGSSFADYAHRFLDNKEYRISLIFDAISRVTRLRYPEDADGRRRDLCPEYNHAGALARVSVDGHTFINEISYNAKGQRLLIRYGNGVITRHAYDAIRSRLIRLRTESYLRLGEHSFRPSGAPLQECAYHYDLAGNIVKMRDRTPDSGSPNSLLGTNALDRTFEYDALYQLTAATGRECSVPLYQLPWDTQQRCTDPANTRPYNEHYHYDALGNVTNIDHYVQEGGIARTFHIDERCNRLSSTSVGADDFTYIHDRSGNVIRETSSRHFEWDHSNRLRGFRAQPSGAIPSIYIQYFYDSSGQRVKRIVRKQGGQVESTVYIDGIFEQRLAGRPGETAENSTLMVADNRQIIALIRIGIALAGDTSPSITYYLADNLGSAHLVLDSTGTCINREEYSPFGSTTFGGFAQKRYRYVCKEREEHSGLYYYGARYYAPWLGRWISCDPAGAAGGLNPYAYVSNMPINRIDAKGLQQSTPSVDLDEFTVEIDGKATPLKEVYAMLDPKPPSQEDRLKAEDGAFETALFNYIAKTGVGVVGLLTGQSLLALGGSEESVDLIHRWEKAVSIEYKTPEARELGRTTEVMFEVVGLVGSLWGGVELGASKVAARLSRVPALGVEAIELADIDPILSEAARLRPGDLFPPEYRGIVWKPGDPPTYPARGRYPSWTTVQKRTATNLAREGTPLPLDPISPGRGKVPIDHIVGQRFNVLDPHNPGNLWVNDTWGWLEHAFFDQYARARDAVGRMWRGPWQ